MRNPAQAAAHLSGIYAIALTAVDNQVTEVFMDIPHVIAGGSVGAALRGEESVRDLDVFFLRVLTPEEEETLRYCKLNDEPIVADPIEVDDVSVSAVSVVYRDDALRCGPFHFVLPNLGKTPIAIVEGFDYLHTMAWWVPGEATVGYRDARTLDAILGKTLIENPARRRDVRPEEDKSRFDRLITEGWKAKECAP